MTDFASRKKSALPEFAPGFRYEIDMSFGLTLLPVFPIHTKSKCQFQEGQMIEYKRHYGDLELNV